MLPSILQQLGPEGLTHLKRLASEVAAGKLSVTADDDEVPELTSNFEDAANADVAGITSKTAEVTVA